jgi:xanthine dehydrogenase accessory factor
VEIMENLDLMVLRSLRDWRRAGRRAVLVTVTRTWGSSPRPVGSIMAMAQGGAVVGSVSGGCIEDDMIAQYAQNIPGGPPRQVRYGVSADEAHRFGLPCGGTLELLLEFDPDADALDALVQTLERGELQERVVSLQDGQVELRAVSAPQPLRLSEQQLSNTFGPEFRMLIIGAGQLSEYLATMALFCGFAVTVCDPRDEYSGAWSVPGVTLTREMPDDVVQSFRPDARSCVVALTHDPKLDDLALLEALQSEAFYVGAIGSRRNNRARHARMIEHFGHTQASLARLRGPIGIYIGSKMPSEIAVSVMAEILAVKNRVPLPRDLEVGPAKDQRDIEPNDPGVMVCAVKP